MKTILSFYKRLSAFVGAITMFFDNLVMRWYKILALLTWVGALIIFYWVYADQYFPIKKFEVVGYTVTDSKIQSPEGKQIVLKELICSNSDGVINSSYQFVDHVIYTLPGTSFSVEKGCHVFRDIFTIPAAVYPDTYTLKAIVRARVNPIRIEYKRYDLLDLHINPKPPYYNIHLFMHTSINGNHTLEKIK
jgi:hypothetical protein